jgi:hypothetical protein
MMRDGATMDYAHSGTGKLLTADPLPDGGVEIVIPTKRRALRVALARASTTGSLMAGFLLVPVLWPVFIFTIRNTPRAVLRLTREELMFRGTKDTNLGWRVDARRWGRSAITEIRRNRGDGGIHLSLIESESVDLLQDLSNELIDQIIRYLKESNERLQNSKP